MSLVSIFGRVRRAPRQPGARSPVRRKSAPIGLVILFMMLAVILGIVGASNSPALVMLAGGAIMATMLFVLVDTYSMLLCVFVGTFLIQGTLLYFLGMRSATWVAVGLAMMFFARVVLDMVLNPHRSVEKPDGRGTSVIVAAFLYLLIFAASIVINRVSATQIISSIKAALPMFGILFAFYWTKWEQRKLEVLWRIGIIVAVIQLPVALFQNIAYSSLSYDSVVGTFGGHIGGGGNSAIMVLFCLTMMVYALARWDRGLMSTGLMAGVCVAVLGVIMLSEVKAAFVWLPLAAGWVLRKRIFKNLFAVIGYTTLLAAFLGGTYFVYSKLYWSGYKHERTYTVSETLEARGGYFFDVNGIDYRTGEVSRVAAIAIWLRDPQASVPRELLGYGPSASKTTGSLGRGTVARRYAPLAIDSTSLAQLLWDVGVLGAAAYTAILLTALSAGLNIIRKAIASASQSAMVETSIPLIFIMLSTIPYNKTVVEEPTAQLLLVLSVATIVQIIRFGGLEWKKVITGRRQNQAQYPVSV